MVYTDTKAGEAATWPEGPAFAPPIALSVEEQRAIVDFGERVAILSPERADALALNALPLLSEGGENLGGNSSRWGRG